MEQEECTPYKFTIAGGIDTGVLISSWKFIFLYAGNFRDAGGVTTIVY